MAKSVIIIGNKPLLKSVNINDIIDSFDSNIRLNFGLPGINMGSKFDRQYMNCHVYDNMTTGGRIRERINMGHMFNVYGKYMNRETILKNV